MFSFLKNLSSKDKASDKGEFGAISKVFLRIRDFPPVLDIQRKDKLKKKLLNKIKPDAKLQRDAEILDHRIKKRVKLNSPKTTLDYLVVLATMLANLPKVSPRVVWRERLRSRFENVRVPFFAVLRQAAAMVLAITMIGGIAATLFVSVSEPVLAEVGELSIEKGTALIKPLGESFFTQVLDKSVVKVGDSIKVNQDSVARLSLLDKSEIELAEETEISITNFELDSKAAESSLVEVALSSGSVQAVVNKPDKSAFKIATPTGSIEAQDSDFSVVVNPTTGSTEIAQKDGLVELKSVHNSQPVELEAGQKAVFSEGQVLLAENSDSTESSEFVLPGLGSTKLKADLVQIELFEALAVAQRGDVELANKVQSLTHEKLKDLMVQFGAEDVETDRIEALKLIVQKSYPDNLDRELTLRYLTKAQNVEKLLNYYLVLEPKYLRGIAEFELLPNRYSPPARLKQVFTTLYANKLAYQDVRILSDELVKTLTDELLVYIKGGDVKKRSEEIVADANQAIYLPIMKSLQTKVPAKFSEVFEDRILEMEKNIATYKGS